MKKFTVKQNSTLRSFTDATYPQGSFVFLSLLKKGDIRVNGARQRADCPVSEGDEVVYYTTAKQESMPSHTVVYEDENVLVADKVSGVSSEALFCETGLLGVHRLDRNTSGLIILAKTEAAQSELTDAFRERRVDKTYLCIAKNAFRQRHGVLTAYIAKDEKQSFVRVYPDPSAGRERIVTEYAVEETADDLARVRVTLHTGKTHQIRAHLAYIGCPVLGDEKYGDFALNRKYRVTRQILISHALSLQTTGKLSYLGGKVFESAFYPDFPSARGDG